MTITIKKYPHSSAAKKDIGKPREPSGSKSNIVYYNKREQILRILQLCVKEDKFQNSKRVLP